MLQSFPGYPNQNCALINRTHLLSLPDRKSSLEKRGVLHRASSDARADNPTHSRTQNRLKDKPSGYLSLSLPPQQSLLPVQHIQDPVEGNLSLAILQYERALSQSGNL